MKSAAHPLPHPLSCRACFGAVFAPAGHKNGFELLRCVACKTVNADPLPSDEELAKFYSEYVKGTDYPSKKASKIRRSKHRMRRIARTGARGRFLDIGCNVGYMVEAARMAGFEAYGIDIDGMAVAAAKRNFPDVAGFELISIQDLAARGDTFDIVYLSEVIEHIRDPDDFLAALAKVMKPGALLYITTPDGAHFSLPKDFVKWGSTVCPPEHLTYFSRKGIKALLARHGLKVEKFQLAFKPGIKAFARKT